tara:strand:- start:473 stop:670 length:198 start_codon:yes stop_codon:yes gene_type:complete
MLKVGDRVCPFNHMSRTGTVLEVKMRKTKTWMVGGTSGETVWVIVEHDDNGEHKLYRSADLRVAE